MNENLNLLEVLKDCPKGTKLYSTIFGEVEFVDCDNLYQIVVAKGNKYYYFTLQGVFIFERIKYHTGECVLFPSKDQRDWSKFNPKNEELVPPCEFKDGDILSYQCGYLKNRSIYIYRYHKTLNTAYYVALSGNTNPIFRIDNKGECALNGYDHTVRFATEEEKQKLFDAIKEKGYKWNAETKTLEKLVEPKFKVGDWLCTNELNDYANNIKIVNIVDVFGKKRYKISRDYDPDLDLVEFNFIEEHYHLWTIQDAKDGDVLALSWLEDKNLWEKIIIFKKYHSGGVKGLYSMSCVEGYGNTFKNGKIAFNEEVPHYSKTWTCNLYPATKEQRDTLMKAINDAGYKWNAETKTLEKLVEPKFDPKTLQPFDKVLVCNCDGDIWRCSIFSHIYEKDSLPSVCNGIGYKYCIPYNNDTKHLAGTTDKAPEFYRYWED